MAIEIEFDERLFNPIFWEIKNAMDDGNIRSLFCYGGAGAGKSYSIVQAIVIRMISLKNENFLVFRKFGVDIVKTIFNDFKTVIKSFELTDYFTIIQNKITCNVTGNYCVFSGVEDIDRVKGLSGFRMIFMEELDQFTFNEYSQFQIRLRGMKNQMIVSAFNPTSEFSFIKVDIFDNEVLIPQDSEVMQKWVNSTGEMVILKTNYKDNNYINGKIFYDKHTINNYEKLKKTNYNYYRVYVDAEWGVLRTGGEYLKNFNTNYHTKKVSYNKDLPLHITFDENVNPYVTCTIWQLDGRILNQIDEILLPDPRNTLKFTCNEFINRYDGHESGLFIYGDATSRKQDTKLEKGTNFYTLILLYLASFKPQLRLNSTNPSVVMSKLFLDAIYNNEYDIRIYIDSDSCKKSIYDYQYSLEDSNGGIDKRTVVNKLTGIRYQEFGHIVDAKKYLVTYLFNSEYKTFILGGRKTSIIKIGRNKTRHVF